MLKTFGQIAGIGGLALGVMLLVFRSVIAKNIFPRLDKQDAYRLLRLIIVLAWSVGVLGIVVYAVEKLKEKDPKQVAAEFQRTLLAVPQEAVSRNVVLQNFRNAGIFRILPRGKYDGQIAMSGGGSYYSFSNRSNEYGVGSDLELDAARFRIGFAGLDYGLFMSLGDVQLSQLKDATSKPPTWLPKEKEEAWRFLWTFVPARGEHDIRVEQQKARNWTVQGTTLSDGVAALANTTYLLRSIQFDRSDLLVAIRVDEVMYDGSRIVVWSLLHQFDTPVVNH